MAKPNFQHGQNLLFEDMLASYHSSHRDVSIVQVNIPSAERRKILSRHPYYYVTIANTVYFKVPTKELLSPAMVDTNRGAAYLLEKEDD